MRNFGEILLIGGKSSWGKKNMRIQFLFTGLFKEVDFYQELGKKLPIPQFRMSDPEKRASFGNNDVRTRVIPFE